ncbi:hypothetical protein CKQ90_29335, partial [Klebsiella pneumoniae]
PRSSDDGSNYDIIARVKDAVATPGETELKQMTAFYQELTALRNLLPAIRMIPVTGLTAWITPCRTTTTTWVAAQQR